jgi:hypothetical protein
MAGQICHLFFLSISGLSESGMIAFVSYQKEEVLSGRGDPYLQNQASLLFPQIV